MNIEPLEARIAPATIIVTNLTDVDGDADAVCLREAIATANSTPGADTILFASDQAGTLVLERGEMVITAPLTIVGGGRVTISGDEATRIFNVDDGVLEKDSPLTLNGLRLIDGKPAGGGNGGAIRSSEGLKLVDCLFESNTSTINGGAVYVSTPVGSVIIERTHFTDNSSTGEGGSLSARSGKAVTIKDSVFADSTSAVGAGAWVDVVSETAKITISGSIFSGNTANQAAEGGGLYVAGYTGGDKLNKIAISDSQFVGNRAGAGGGLAIMNGDFTLTNVNVASNTAALGGGGLYVGGEMHLLKVSKCAFVGNVVNNGSTGGGGVLLASSTDQLIATFTDCQIVENYIDSTANADSSGAGIYALNIGGRLTIAKSLIADNHAKVQPAGNIGRGGGIATFGTGAAATDLVLTGNTIVGNEAEIGGGVYATGDGKITLTKNRIIGNAETSPTNGQVGGASLLSSTSIVLSGNSIIGNRSVAGVGGLGLGSAVMGATFSSTGDVVAHNEGKIVGGMFTNPSIAGTIAKTTRIFGNLNNDAGAAAGVTASGGVTLLAVVTGNYNRNAGGPDQIGGSFLNTPPTAPALAGNIVVTSLADSGAGSLREAIAQANDTVAADKIVFDPALAGGTILLTGGEIFIANPVTISGGGDIAISCSNNSRIFRTTSDLTLSGLTLVEGKADDGGAIHGLTGKLTMIGCNLLGSFASDDGAALYWESDLAVTIKDTFFSGNGDDDTSTAQTDSGGAARLISPKIAISGSTFSGNVAASGGGVSVTQAPGGTVTMTGTQFIDNAVSSGGGGAVVSGSIADAKAPKAALFGLTFVRNDAGGIGGGLSFRFVGAHTVTGSLFVDNHAEDGGGLYVGSDLRSVAVSKSTFVGNSVDSSVIDGGGGGALLSGRGLEGFTATFSSIQFLANVANGSGLGGGLFADNIRGKLIVNASRFIDNAAATGGGIAARGAGALATEVALSANTFIAGQAATGAGLSLVVDGPLTLSKNFLLANEASTGGGGAVLQSIGKIALSGNAIIGNDGAATIGGLLISGAATATFSTSGDRILFNEGGGTGGLQIEGAIAGVIAKSVKITGNVGDGAFKAGGLTQESTNTNNVRLLATILGNLHRTDPFKNETFGLFAP